MTLQKKQGSKTNHNNGSVLVLVMVSMTALFLLGIGLMQAAYGVRHRAIMVKNEAAAMLAAEGGYEKAIFWMSQQQDMLDALAKGVPGTTGTLSFPEGQCNYKISLHTFVGSRPIFQITSKGTSGVFSRTVDVKVMQAISGWDMGECRAASGGNKTSPVYFTSGEFLDMPIHINNLDESPDSKDIYITGSPNFDESVWMGESRYTAYGSDKYSGVMGLFDGGISFNQPDARITDEASITTKVNRFKNSTKSSFKFTPVATAASKITGATPAVQLEFFVDNGVGKVRITNNCTVRSFKQGGEDKTWDFLIKPNTGGKNYIRYGIYGYHVKDDNVTSVTMNISDTYVTQQIGGIESLPGGQIFVDGNVVIGGDDTSHSNNQVINGKITVVATGNIWIADSIQVDGTHNSNGVPAEDNPNILGLISQGVIKVVDPGMTEYSYVDGTVVEPEGFQYSPIGLPDETTGSGGSSYGKGGKGGKGGTGGKGEESNENYSRYLPDPMIIEAVMTIGGGGFGAENVARYTYKQYYGGRKEAPKSGKVNNLIVRGAITEALRGVVGLIGEDGFIKKYYMDNRVLEGIVPGDLWLSGKYVPAPAGWHDYRSNN